MNWPRGKYNGQAITGLELKIVIDLSSWRLWPIWLPDAGGNAEEFTVAVAARDRIRELKGWS